MQKLGATGTVERIETRISQEEAPVLPQLEALYHAGTVELEQRARVQAAQQASSSVPATPRQVAEAYFEAHNRHDLKAMERLYAPNATFDDNVFHFRDRAGILGMWAGVPADGHVDHQILEVNGDQVKAKLSWSYTLFGKKLHNEELSWLNIENGRITRQREEMSFGRWAHQLIPLPESMLSFLEPVLAPALRWSTELAQMFK